ncbi:hypothetical protein L207DRAFT_628726 [Hyaloscypha variabilis F]|uniref:PLAC8-domain-containing protein n=1 Tax=Hyaloscypha variabilis (strain UAMH 11265 / GT02V1 / F) TaxID=1149755 RepID=A0A2J6S5U0_HYAVF|nr:hypothetical protein L207DRAFT_628726 [Hyaloscypha variabilis F]
MPEAKKSELQRQASEKLQAKATATIPVHRDSITILRQTSIIPKPPGSMADRAAVPDTSSRELEQSGRRRSSHQQLPPQIDEWKTQFCVEPQGDLDTCCLGTWVPCALYGKVNERLRQKAQGDFDTDYSWRTSDGCNSACWAYWACACISGTSLGHGVLSGAAAGWQRSQIRGTYGIRGNCVEDIALGIFCAPCVLIQSDREFRVRENEDSALSFEYNRLRPPKHHEKKNNAVGGLHCSREREDLGMIQLQPRPKAKMVARGMHDRRDYYEAWDSIRACTASGEQHDENCVCSRPTECPNQGQQIPPRRSMRGRLTRTLDQEAEQRETAPSTKATAQIEAGTVKTFDQEQQKGKVASKEQVAGEPQNNPDKKSELVVLKKRHRGQEVLPVVVITGPEGSDELANEASSSQSAGKCALIGPSISSVLSEVDTRENQPTASAEGYTEGNQNGKVGQHTLSECRPTIEPTPAPTTVQQHALSECVQFSSAPTAKQQHGLSERVHSSSTSPKVEETSYVHDFSECPGTVLEYYKKGGKKAQPQDPTDRRTGRPTNNRKSSNKVEEHLLEDCSKPICENCEFIGKGVSHEDTNDEDGMTTHNLGECSGRNSTALRLPILQHTLADCSSERPRNSTARSENQIPRANGAKENSRDGEQHRLSSCPTPIAVTGNRVGDKDTCRLNVDGLGE